MGGTPMEVSASTDVFDSPDLPTVALPSLARMDQVAANNVDHRMTDDDNHDGEAGLASHSNSSGSTVILDQEMSHSSPPTAPSPPTAEALAPPSTSIDQRLHSPTKVANGLSSETVPAGPARSSKRIRATPSTSTRRSSTSLSTSPEISQGPLPKRRKGSTAGSTNGKSTKSAGAAAAPVKREVVEADEDGLMDELEEELDEMDAEGEKKPKVLLTAVSHLPWSYSPSSALVFVRMKGRHLTFFRLHVQQEQKRTNHILSEQKRRNAIRTGYVHTGTVHPPAFLPADTSLFTFTHTDHLSVEQLRRTLAPPLFLPIPPLSSIRPVRPDRAAPSVGHEVRPGRGKRRVKEQHARSGGEPVPVLRGRQRWPGAGD